MLPKKFLELTAFEWDAGNVEKSWTKHKVLPTEGEQVFFNQPLVVAVDEKHSSVEARYYALGRTDANRYLFVVFTVRGRKIRIISVRDMNRRERKVYDS